MDSRRSPFGLKGQKQVSKDRAAHFYYFPFKMNECLSSYKVHFVANTADLDISVFFDRKALIKMQFSLNYGETT